jgi:competence protein ComEC
LCRQPFLYLALSFVAGILADIGATPARWVGTTLSLIAIVISIGSMMVKRDRTASAAILAAFVAAGILLSNAERVRVAHSPLKLLVESGSINPDNAVELIGVLARPPEPAPDVYYLDLDVESIRTNAEPFYAPGRIRLRAEVIEENAKREFDSLSLEYGTRVRVLVILGVHRGYRNPGSPDFNEPLERQGYHLSGSIRSPLLIERLGDAPVNPILVALYSFRLRVIRAIDVNLRPPVAGTLKAMLVDSRYFLDRETAERLREGGTFHIISISGMHVGIIAVVLLGGISRTRRRGRLRVSLVAVVLWAYAVMVGLAPPVTRATMMITIGLIGPLLFRRAISINTVALAAFVMLALKPRLVADPGFQLSFVAVAGIVTLALPLTEKLSGIGEWRPSSRTPHPPTCSRVMRILAEALFWDDQSFREEMRKAPVNFRLEKARAARLLGRLRLQAILRSCVLLIVTSTAIQLSTLPLTVFYFNRVTPVGVLLNLVAGVLTAVLMGAGTLAITVGALSHWLRSVFGSVAAGAHFALANAIVPFSELPFASFRAAHYEGRQATVYALYFIPLVLLAVLIDAWSPFDRKIRAVPGEREGRGTARIFPQPRQRAARWICALSLIISVAAVVHPMTPRAKGKLTIHFLDVGQGDSAFIVFPQGSTMLVDGGGEIDFDSKRNHAESFRGADGAPIGAERVVSDRSFAIGESVVSRFIWSTHRTRVDYLLATHAHVDHIGGLSQVADNFSVGEAIFGHLPPGNVEFDRLAGKFARHGVPLAEVSAGESFELEGVRIEVLWPPKVSNLPATSGNNDSVVLRLVFGSVRVLLAGDIERPAEEDLVRSGFDLRADVLKVPHHGSKTSSTAAFIDAVSPSCAVLSVGERSRFGHPSPEVVGRYVARGTNVVQTGRNGMITVETNGATVEVATYRR